MPSFGKRSRDNLATCHPDLQLLCNTVVRKLNISVITGHRNKKDQNLKVAQGLSWVRWPKGKHNSNPSNAVDLAVWHKERPRGKEIDWKSRHDFSLLAGYMFAYAEMLGIKLRWGGTWSCNPAGKLSKKKYDGGHFELKNRTIG